MPSDAIVLPAIQLVIVSQNNKPLVWGVTHNKECLHSQTEVAKCVWLLLISHSSLASFSYYGNIPTTDCHLCQHYCGLHSAVCKVLPMRILACLSECVLTCYRVCAKMPAGDHRCVCQFHREHCLQLPHTLCILGNINPRSTCAHVQPPNPPPLHGHTQTHPTQHNPPLCLRQPGAWAELQWAVVTIVVLFIDNERKQLNRVSSLEQNISLRYTFSVPICGG